MKGKKGLTSQPRNWNNDDVFLASVLFATDAIQFEAGLKRELYTRVEWQYMYNSPIFKRLMCIPNILVFNERIREK